MIPLLLLISIAQAGQATGTPADSALTPDTTYVTGDARVYCWTSPRLVVTRVPDTLRFIYNARNTATVDSVAVRDGLRCAVNGSFFDGVRGNAAHAGWLSLYGRPVSPIRTDPELTHVVRLDGRVRSIAFIPVAPFARSADPGVVEFQTGPLVIDGGTIRSDLIRSSLNGMSRHARTLLASCGRRRLFLVTVPEPATLEEIAARLIRLSVFREGKLDVINLDGGSSVSLFVRGIPQLGVNVGDRLPILLGFR